MPKPTLCTGFSPAGFRGTGKGRGTRGEKPQPETSQNLNAQSQGFQGVQGEDDAPQWGGGRRSVVHWAPVTP